MGIILFCHAFDGDQQVSIASPMYPRSIAGLDYPVMSSIEFVDLDVYQSEFDEETPRCYLSKLHSCRYPPARMQCDGAVIHPHAKRVRMCVCVCVLFRSFRRSVYRVLGGQGLSP